MFKKIMLLMSILLMMLSVSLASASSTPDIPEYDPQIHIYVEGMEEGIMKDHVRYGTLASLNQQISGFDNSDSLSEKKSEGTIIVPIFEDGIIPKVVESGSWFYPRAWPWNSGNAQNPSNIRWNSCGGGDDAWADYYYVLDDDLFGNKLRVWATHWASKAHIVKNGGLDGGYYCVGGYCTVSVCTTQEYNANPWSVYVLHLN